jgi:hypothetical protein
VCLYDQAGTWLLEEKETIGKTKMINLRALDKTYAIRKELATAEGCLMRSGNSGLLAECNKRGESTRSLKDVLRYLS